MSPYTNTCAVSVTHALTLCLLTLSALTACYDELTPPLCYKAQNTQPERSLSIESNEYTLRYRELENICISRVSEAEDFNETECEDLWFGDVVQSERVTLFEQMPRLLTLQAIPVEGAPLYARCLPRCDSDSCECERHEDCGAGERCLGPRLRPRSIEANTSATAFCVAECTREELARCPKQEEGNQSYYCDLGSGAHCFYPESSAIQGGMEIGGMEIGGMEIGGMEIGGMDAGVEAGVEAGSALIPYEPQAPIQEAEYNPVALVDPMIATGGMITAMASVTPAASAPNGMTLVGPDTSLGLEMSPLLNCAGYHYNDDHIQGFSHTHAHGMGVTDYGGISLMPRARWAPDYLTFKGRAAPFTHDQEHASPGEYRVTLGDDGTRVKIVATERGAHHSYTFIPSFDPADEHVVIIDLGDNLVNTQTISAQLAASGEEVTMIQVLDGSYSGRFGGVIHHAVLRFDPAPTSYQVWVDDGELMDGESASGRTAGLVARFPSTTDSVQALVGLSFVDLEGARANLEAELPDFNYEARLEEVRQRWSEALSTVKVRSSNLQDLKRFATAHYHSLLMPSLNSDVDGRYRGLDQELHQLPEGERYYSDLSLWDTFRTLHSFYLLAHPTLQRDILKSLVRMTQEGGSLPRWPLAHGYTGGMIGTPATQLFAEAHLKGLTGWDVEAGYRAALAQSDNEAEEATRSGGESYDLLGWVPADEQQGSVSRTLEFAWSDNALASLARALGHEEDVARLERRASSWRNHWNPMASEDDGGFMSPRDADGSFRELYDPKIPNPLYYIEGTAWHYLWSVPYDVEGLIEVQHGGDREAFLARLDEFWGRVKAAENQRSAMAYYWHGNEPDLHYAWLGSLAADYELSVDISHYLLESRYGHSPADGLDGNDDSGTLSAWYLFAAMGFYPVAGTDQYALGAPIFTRIEVNPSESEAPTWVIEAPLTEEDGSRWHQMPKYILQLPATPEDQARIQLPSVIPHETLTQGLWFVD